MDPISSIASINRLISARKLKEKEPKPRSGNTANNSSQPSNKAENLSQTIAHAIQQLPSKQQTGTEGIKLLVEGIVQSKFGDSAIQDPLIQKNIDKMMKSIISDNASKKATEELIKDLLSSTQK